MKRKSKGGAANTPAVVSDSPKKRKAAKHCPSDSSDIEDITPVKKPKKVTAKKHKTKD